MAKATPKKQALGKVAVIGGCGFLGHHLIDLILRDYTTSLLCALDLTCVRNRRPESDGVVYIEADITDPTKLVSIFEKHKFDVVIHTASPPPLMKGPAANALFDKVNVQGTTNIIEACKQTLVKALVFTSSASTLSDNVTDLINADERWPLIRGAQQTSYYTETKAQADELVLAANRTGPLPLLTTSIRPAGIIGEGDLAITAFVDAYHANRTNVQLGDNNNLFDFTIVENVAHAHLLAALALLATSSASTAPLDHEKVDGEAFLITNDSPVYFWDLTRVVWNESGCKLGKDHVWAIPRDMALMMGGASEVVSGWLGKKATFTRTTATFAMMTRYYNIDKAKMRLGYKPIVPFEEGLRKATRWTVEQKAKAKA